MLLLQQSVGFLIVLALLVRYVELFVTHLQARAYAWVVVYGIVCLLLLLAALVALGFHA